LYDKKATVGINLFSFGVCCLFTVSTSGSTVNQNCTYVRNPGFPTALTATTAITYTVNKIQSGIDHENN